MIIPSIDIIAGRTVQLIGGREQALDAGDPFPWLERFALAGEVAIVDLDAARGVGDNRELIARLCAAAPCRVGGGIRDLERARFWLDAGAERIVIGTAASPALLRELPRERLVVALDAIDGEVVVDGWETRTGRGVLERIAELREFTAEFMVTFVEREGRLGGTDLEFARRIVAAASPARVTIAGGVTTAAEIAELDRIGADAQVGMALYTGKL
ncbi:MAG: HisA/HisF-related TIM barrel protein, partial [Gemmatimonadota bacterium]